MATPESPMNGKSLKPMKGKSLGPEGQKGRHLCADIFGLSRQENSCSFRRSGRRPKDRTERLNKAQRSVERWRRCLPLSWCVSVCRVCALSVALSFVVSEASFPCGHRPEDQTRQFRYPFTTASLWWSVLPGFHAVTYGAASPLILVDLSLLSTLRRLVSASISSTSLRRRFCPLLRHRQTAVDLSILVPISLSSPPVALRPSSLSEQQFIEYNTTGRLHCCGSHSGYMLQDMRGGSSLPRSCVCTCRCPLSRTLPTS